jgi:hypothetical protein
MVIAEAYKLAKSVSMLHRVHGPAQMKSDRPRCFLDPGRMRFGGPMLVTGNLPLVL